MPVNATRSITIAQSGGTAVSTATGWIPLARHQTPFDVGFGVVISGDIEYRVEHTFDDVQDSSITPTAFTHDQVSANQANADGSYEFPVNAVRLAVVSAGVSGVATLTLLQAGI